ncbi:hypothetical protein [Paenibacillus montanisoli]|uniref:Group-specific protein n=1 Tax=Paenibacillus montanisoli TaxID=2081970 RepID=A0A328TZZ8_9BACL|nr:hypothetical protein [Paenibacillus montanisoli]RAP76137.1 hypothetical protein DL346_12025 [Paenibacillus montanisoli]
MQTLTMRSESAYTLNYLIYIQNMYLNQRDAARGERHKFPYLPNLKLPFADDFEAGFANIWAEASASIAEHPFNDLKLFAAHRERIFEPLFVHSEGAWEPYECFYQSFLAWWDSYAGRLALERTFDAWRVYTVLSAIVQAAGGVPLKGFEISIVYDACVLGSEDKRSYFAVMPLADCLVNSLKLEQRLMNLFDWLNGSTEAD